MRVEKLLRSTIRVQMHRAALAYARGSDQKRWTGSGIQLLDHGWEKLKMYRPLAFSMVCLSVAITAFAQQYPDRQSNSRDRNRNYGDTYYETIPADTRIYVRTGQTIDVRDRSDGRVFSGTVAEDVTSPDGRLRIPRGAVAELIVQNTGENQMA